MIPILFSVSDFFVPYFAVCLQSLQECVNSQDQYQIIVMQRNISAENKQRLLSLIRHRNMTLEFYDAKSVIREKKFKSHEHVSDETFFKLFLPQLFSKYKKILFCDSDILFRDDPAKLFRIPIGRKKIAAAPCQLWHGIMQHDARAYDYTINQLGVKDLDSYFQGGVILFQPPLISQQDVQKMIELAETREFICMDQDILNIVFQDDVFLLDNRWNYETSQPGFREISIPFMRKDHEKAWKKAGKNPAIIHYSGKEKPWFFPDEEYADSWWKMAEKTPYYERLKIRSECFQIVNWEMKQLRDEFYKIHFPNINRHFEAVFARMNPVKVWMRKCIYGLKWIVLHRDADRKKYFNLKRALKCAKSTEGMFIRRLKKGDKND